MIRLDADIIRELYPNVVSIYHNPDGTKKSYDSDGNLVDVDYEKVNKEYDSRQYQRDRASAYPSTADQLDLLYHQGIDGWKAEIKKVKDAHPKPSE